MSQPDRPPRRWTAVAVRWLSRVGLLLGGWLLLSRLVSATGGPQSGATPVSDPTGRGQHADLPSPEARAAGHETSDVNALYVARLAVSLLVGASIIIGGMVVMQRLLRRNAVSEQPGLTAEQKAPLPPPAPNLQADPPADLVQLNDRDNGLLDRYAWIDPDHAKARIPIQRAMALMAGRSLESAP